MEGDERRGQGGREWGGRDVEGSEGVERREEGELGSDVSVEMRGVDG